MDRRKFIAVAGGGVILGAGAGAGFVMGATPTKAIVPWQQAGTAYSEPRRKALSYAILAPNPHNRQPWLVDLSQENRIILKVDLNRLLPQTDPFSRQIIIGLGCFLEVLRLAGAQDGYRLKTQVFPQGSDPDFLDERPVAMIEFVEDATVKPDELFAQVLNRRSHKLPFDINRIISAGELEQVVQVAQSGLVVGASINEEYVAPLTELTEEALLVEIKTLRTHKESVDLFRIGKDEVEASPDGIALSGPLFEFLSVTGILSREAALDVNSRIYRESIRAVLANVQSAMGFVWIVSEGNSREEQIRAGIDWVRINLATTGFGIGVQPLSQPLQEYEEMAGLFERCKSLLAPNGGTVQMLARLGYAQATGPTPRWQLDEKIIAG